MWLCLGPGLLIRIDCFEVRLVIIWQQNEDISQTAEGIYIDSVFKAQVDMYQIVTQIDKCDSMSRLTLLLSLSSTFHATVKLLDLQLLQAEAHGQVSAM